MGRWRLWRWIELINIWSIYRNNDFWLTLELLLSICFQHSSLFSLNNKFYSILTKYHALFADQISLISNVSQIPSRLISQFPAICSRPFVPGILLESGVLGFNYLFRNCFKLIEKRSRLISLCFNLGRTRINRVDSIFTSWASPFWRQRGAETCMQPSATPCQLV